ncbi:MAG: tail fiber protein [Cyanobacteria bacterium P01_G01_bin.49]
MTVPIGTIMAYAGAVDGNAKGQLERQGWLVCDVEEYSESDYQELENTIGVYYGRPSRAGMFKVPDLRGRFVRGVDNGAGRDPDASSRSASAEGGNTGDMVGSAQDDEFKSHTHVSTRENVPGDTNMASGTAGFQNYGDTHAAGGAETRPKNIYVNWIIKAKDV